MQDEVNKGDVFLECKNQGPTQTQPEVISFGVLLMDNWFE